MKSLSDKKQLLGRNESVFNLVKIGCGSLPSCSLLDPQIGGTQRIDNHKLCKFWFSTLRLVQNVESLPCWKAALCSQRHTHICLKVTLTLANGKDNFTGWVRFLFIFLVLFFKILFIYLFLAVLGLCCCTRAFSSCRERGLLFIAVRGLLIAVASLVEEHGL